MLWPVIVLKNNGMLNRIAMLALVRLEFIVCSGWRPRYRIDARAFDPRQFIFAATRF
jgi:hypothetical protein